MKNIYLVSQNEEGGYDTYDSFVCYAPDEKAAAAMHPCGDSDYNWPTTLDYRWGSCWASSPDCAQVAHIGFADSPEEARVICASFNAG